MRSVSLLALLLPVVPVAARRVPAPDVRALPSVVANDNRRAAGTLRGDTLRLQLTVQMAEWYPDGSKGAHVSVEAFGEEGKAPTIPAPLLRMRVGTVVDATVRNTLPATPIHVTGLWSHPATGADTLHLAPGETRTVRFVAGAPGTYLYAARIGNEIIDRSDNQERETAIGAFIVDPPGPIPPDRVLVMNIWGQRRDSTHYANALAINGLSWPSNERLRAVSGDTLRWRVINGTGRSHPMHLHGFYFTAVSRGNAAADTARAPNAQFASVTERMTALTTMEMVWVPTRPGNWLFHCHIAAHVIPEAAQLVPPDAMDHSGHSTNASEHMRGLVLGISVAPRRGERPAARVGTRTLRLEVREDSARTNGARRMRYVLDGGSQPLAPWRAGGPVLVLQRGQPTDVNVVNRLAENTAVHWHGIELESWSDGVAGWSGTKSHPAPAIAPADSFMAHLTVPRAGTFIYHTHLGDNQQLRGGLYGALLVLPEGQNFDPTVDHVFIAGLGGAGDENGFVVNGDRLESAPLVLHPGVPHRMRFIGITANNTVTWTFQRDSSVTTWTTLAKDGADLPLDLQRAVPARMITTVGETRDFVFTPPTPGEYVLRAAIGAANQWQQRMIVRP